METTARAAVPPVAPEDDPWATLAAPVEELRPVPGGIQVPVMPWDPPDGADAPGGPDVAPVPDVAAVPDAAAVPDVPADDVPGGPDRQEPPAARVPERVPTAVAASAPQVSFPLGVASKLAVYVYLLVDARTGRPFLVARGRGDRCFRHVEAARADATADAAAGGKRTKFAGLDRIREAESDGRPVRIDVLRHGLTLPEADLVVAAVDDALALGSAPAAGSQRGSAVELGAALAKRAKIKRSHQSVLLRVGPHGTDASYESARPGWRIGRRWVDTESTRAPRWALVVTGDLVDAVYRIDGWEPSSTGGSATRAVERWSFTGTRDAELEDRYAGRSVAAYLGTGTPGPVTYVWCGPHWVNTAQ